MWFWFATSSMLHFPIWIFILLYIIPDWFFFKLINALSVDSCMKNIAVNTACPQHYDLSFWTIQYSQIVVFYVFVNCIIVSAFHVLFQVVLGFSRESYSSSALNSKTSFLFWFALPFLSILIWIFFNILNVFVAFFCAEVCY